MVSFLNNPRAMAGWWVVVVVVEYYMCADTSELLVTMSPDPGHRWSSSSYC